MPPEKPDFDVNDPAKLSAEEAGAALAQVRQERFVKLLEILDRQGIAQSEVARRTDVPPQYLNDVKAGRRSLSERFARRIQDEFGFDYQWLLGRHGSMEVQRVDQGTGPANARRVWLPVFAHPIEGDPCTAAAWDGSSVEIAGVAAIRVLQAERPYALRLGVDDRHQRLCRGDLLLVSQALNKNAKIQVIRSGQKSYLARHLENGEWECLNKENIVGGKAIVIGHVLGILWGAL